MFRNTTIVFVEVEVEFVVVIANTLSIPQPLQKKVWQINGLISLLWGPPVQCIAALLFCTNWLNIWSSKWLNTESAVTLAP